MPETLADPIPLTAFDDKVARAATTNQIRTSIRNTLREACALKQLAFDTALSLKAEFNDSDKADQARARAMAVTSLIKGWGECVDAIRIARGKPLPGSRRPAPDPPKRQPKQTSFTPPAEQ